MSISFSTLPIVSLAALKSASPNPDEISALATKLNKVFSTTGFAYLTDLPLTFTHDDIFGLCDEFFQGLPMDEKMKLAKKTFVKENTNTYRGYFPPQEGSDNLKEGFEFGTPLSPPSTSKNTRFNLTEPNVFPASHPTFRNACETLHTELQALSSQLLCLLAISLAKPPTFFNHYLEASLSTLRLLHYPPVPSSRQHELICTPHTDSGILTLLHQDASGGLEVQNSAGEWIAAPYLPGSMVINIGDLMAKVSSGRWVATYHRVKCSKTGETSRGGAQVAKGRYSAPFFFEPGLDCAIESLDGEKVIYGEHVLEKMKQWVEFQDVDHDIESGIQMA